MVTSYRAGDVIERTIASAGISPHDNRLLIYLILDGTPVNVCDSARIAAIPVLYPNGYFISAGYNPSNTTICSRPVYPAIEGSKLVSKSRARYWRAVGERILLRLRLDGRWQSFPPREK